MPIKVVLTTLALLASPGLAIAQGCSFYDHGQEARMSCAEGLSWDSATGTCVPTVSS